MINFDAVDFSERRFEEVISFFFTLSVFVRDAHGQFAHAHGVCVCGCG